MCNGTSFSTIPPGVPACGFGFWCFFTMFTFWTRTLSFSGKTLITSPRVPLSLPAMTITSSPFLILRILPSALKHFRRQRDDAHELLGAQLAGHRAEYTGADGLQLIVQQHGRIAVKADHRPVGTAHTFTGANDDGVVDLTLLDAPTWNRILDADFDDVADAGVAALGTTKHLDTHNGPRTGVVGSVQKGLHLNHGGLLA